MTICEWEPGTQYGSGSQVRYHGRIYKIIQPHFSQSDWTPDKTPALWGAEPNEGGGGDCHRHPDGGCGQECRPHNQGGGGGGCHKHPDGGCDQDCRSHPHQGGENHPPPYQGGQGQGYHPPQQQQQQQQQQQPYHPPQPPPQGQQGGDKRHDDKDHGWLDDKKKHELEIAGGVLGAAALVGGGVWAYSHHREEEAKDAWKNSMNAENYERSRAQRGDIIAGDRHGRSVYWVPCASPSDLPIPDNAIIVSGDRSDPLFAARAFQVDGSVHPGRARRTGVQTADVSISFADKAEPFHQYEILCGDENQIRWLSVPEGQPFRVNSDIRPVEGGREKEGRFLFVVKAEKDGRWIPGKLQDGKDYALIPYERKESKCRHYQVAVYRND